MTPLENLTQRRADFHRAVDMILNHLQNGNVEETVSLCKEKMFRIPSREMSIETQHGAIDSVLHALIGEALVVLRTERL